MKQMLKVNTPYGEFTRKTATKYTHIVVAQPASRMGKEITGADELAAMLTADGHHTDGVMARVLKDRGYIVSWHSTEAAASKAAIKGNSSYFKTRTGEVFAL